MKNTIQTLLALGVCVAAWPAVSLRAQNVPAIATQPASQTVVAGGTENFSVAVTGPGPFTYQWRLNGTNLPNGIIDTVAGTNGYGFSGDGNPATNASLWYPYNLAFDAGGNCYIADADNLRVRKVTASGTITTVAGNGSKGYAGNNGPATNASLYYPSGVAADNAGNLYIADDENYRVRKVSAMGVITTLAGTGSGAYSGDNGAATNAAVNYPQGVACDAAGNVYIADTFNNRIRKVNTNGIITTVAGNGTPAYTGNNGAATNASLYWPAGVTVDAAGNLYIADTLNERVRKVGTNGIITTVAGNGVAGYAGDGGAGTNASLSGPAAVAVDGWGNLYIADNNNNLIRRVATNGIITTVAGNAAAAGSSGGYSGDGTAAINAWLDNPQGVGFDAAGNLYIADTLNNRVRRVLLYASQPTLTLNSAGTANAGNYSVVITNSFGSVTSAVASLTVTIPPQIIANGTNYGFKARQFGFNISGLAGQVIVVDGSTNCKDWTPLFTNTVVLSPFYFTDPSATNYRSRFYRARLP